jgi:N utilization substance protein B
MASRRKSRERALQVLFLVDLRKQAVEEAIQAFTFTLHGDDEDFGEMTRDKFMEHLVRGSVAQREALDRRIEKASENWRLDRMPTVDRNILRLATFELLEDKLPHPVVIDEALELARRFSGDESVGFVNGVLDAVSGAILAAKAQPEKALAAGAESESSAS